MRAKQLLNAKAAVTVSTLNFLLVVGICCVSCKAGQFRAAH